MYMYCTRAYCLLNVDVLQCIYMYIHVLCYKFISIYVHVLFCPYRPAEEQQGWMSYLGKALATPASILPATVSRDMNMYIILSNYLDTESKGSTQFRDPKV